MLLPEDNCRSPCDAVRRTRKRANRSPATVRYRVLRLGRRTPAASASRQPSRCSPAPSRRANPSGEAPRGGHWSLHSPGANPRCGPTAPAAAARRFRRPALPLSLTCVSPASDAAGGSRPPRLQRREQYPREKPPAKQLMTPCKGLHKPLIPVANYDHARIRGTHKHPRTHFAIMARRGSRDSGLGTPDPGRSCAAPDSTDANRNEFVAHRRLRPLPCLAVPRTLAP